MLSTGLYGGGQGAQVVPSWMLPEDRSTWGRPQQVMLPQTSPQPQQMLPAQFQPQAQQSQMQQPSWGQPQQPAQQSQGQNPYIQPVQPKPFIPDNGGAKQGSNLYGTSGQGWGNMPLEHPTNAPMYITSSGGQTFLNPVYQNKFSAPTQTQFSPQERNAMSQMQNNEYQKALQDPWSQLSTNNPYAQGTLGIGGSIGDQVRAQQLAKAQQWEQQNGGGTKFVDQIKAAGPNNPNMAYPYNWGNMMARAQVSGNFDPSQNSYIHPVKSAQYTGSLQPYGFGSQLPQQLQNPPQGQNPFSNGGSNNNQMAQLQALLQLLQAFGPTGLMSRMNAPMQNQPYQMNTQSPMFNGGGGGVGVGYSMRGNWGQPGNEIGL